MRKKYHVELTADQRQHLEAIIAKGTAPARMQTRARILLKVDVGLDGPGWLDAQVVEALDVSRPTVERVRQTFVTAGLEAALQRRKPTTPPRRKLDGSQEARLIAVTCSTPPDGHERWSLTLLADRLVELGIVDSIAPETVRLTLKKMKSSRG